MCLYVIFFILNLEKNNMILFLQENDDGTVYGTPGYMDQSTRRGTHTPGIHLSRDILPLSLQ